MIAPPHSPEAELGFLGGVLLDPSIVLDFPQIRPEHFYDGDREFIWRKMLELEAQNALDATVLASKLGAPRLKEAMLDMMDAASSPNTAYACAPEVLDLWHQRQMLDLTLKIHDQVDSGTDSDSLRQMVERELLAMDEGSIAASTQSAKDLSGPLVEDLAAGKKTDYGIDTPWLVINSMTRGLHKGEMIVVGGRPSMGKSCFAVNIGLYAARKGHQVGIWSLEVDHKQVTRNLLTMLSGVEPNKVKDGGLVPEEVQALRDAHEKLQGCDINIEAGTYLTPSMFRSQARKMKRKQGLDLVILDYLQLCDADYKKASIYERTTEMSRACKKLAGELQVPVVVLSQLNRDVEKRDDKRPRMSDLKESGAIEQDADVVLLAYRPGYYSNEPESKEAEIIIGKNRNGTTGRVYLDFHGPRLTWQDRPLRTLNGPMGPQ